MSPLIGVTSYFVTGGELKTFKERPRGKDQDMTMSTLDFPNGIVKGGGIPLNITVINKEDYIEKIVDKCDGLLFSGGPDISPSLYGANPDSRCGTIVPTRDEFELKLLDKAIECAKPILGICRGFQLINIYYKGTLKQHIDNHKDELKNHALTKFPRWYKAHKIEVENGSHIKKAYNENELMVNSLHHQAIEEVGNGLTITARASDGIIEGIEDSEKNFLVGLQWHPEMMYFKYEEQLKIFEYFINKVKEIQE